MRELVATLIDWLRSIPSEANAHQLALALAEETRKRVDSPDPAQREFDAQQLAEAAGYNAEDSFDRAKRWVSRAEFEKYLTARRTALEEHFQQAGLSQCLCVSKRTTTGKHRAQWRLVSYDITPIESEEEEPPVAEEELAETTVTYEFSPPGSVRPAWWARLFLGQGSTPTRSMRGVLWAGLVVLGIAEMLLCFLVLWALSLSRRPILTSDLVDVLAIGGVIWVIWIKQLRPLYRLVDDRIVPAGEFWIGMSDQSAQLEFAKVDGRKMIRLVRYSAVCPVCSGKLELRYSEGPNRRRLVGCCDEAPHDHVFSFDRILRSGTRIS